ncbi:MAG: heme-binding protein [Pseudomonadota bacterium]
MLHTIQTISSDSALALVTAARDAAVEQGLRVAIAVTDAQGVVLATLRMDGVSPPVADFALDKAYTAATMGKATSAFADRMTSSSSLSLGLSTRPRLLAWGGGVPVAIDGAVVGGLGVSGARDEEDIACASAALAAGGFDDP